MNNIIKMRNVLEEAMKEEYFFIHLLNGKQYRIAKEHKYRKTLICNKYHEFITYAIKSYNDTEVILHSFNSEDNKEIVLKIPYIKIKGFSDDGTM